MRFAHGSVRFVHDNRGLGAGFEYFSQEFFGCDAREGQMDQYRVDGMPPKGLDSTRDGIG